MSPSPKSSKFSAPFLPLWWRYAPMTLCHVSFMALCSLWCPDSILLLRYPEFSLKSVLDLVLDHHYGSLVFISTVVRWSDCLSFIPISLLLINKIVGLHSWSFCQTALALFQRSSHKYSTWNEDYPVHSTCVFYFQDYHERGNFSWVFHEYLFADVTLVWFDMVSFFYLAFFIHQ